MKEAKHIYQKIVASIPKDIKAEVDLSFAISERIEELMHQCGLSKNSLPMRLDDGQAR